MRASLVLPFLILLSLIGRSQSKTLYVYKEDNKYGYRSGLGEIVIPAKFDTAYDFKFKRGYIIQGGKKGVIDHKGEFIFAPTYSYLEAFENKGLRSNAYVVGDGNKKGLISKNDHLLIPLKYDTIYRSKVHLHYFVYSKKKKMELMRVTKNLDSAYIAISGKFDSINVVSSANSGLVDKYYKAFSKKKSTIFNSSFVVVDEKAIADSKKKYEIEIARKNKERDEMINNQIHVLDMSTMESREKEIEIYDFVDKQPEFPEGRQKLLTYLLKNIRYPENSRNKFIQGRVFLRFVVKKTGEIADPKIMKGINKELDEEAKRVILSMPNWLPGELKGEKVDCYMSLPVLFKIPIE